VERPPANDCAIPLEDNDNANFSSPLTNASWTLANLMPPCMDNLVDALLLRFMPPPVVLMGGAAPAPAAAEVAVDAVKALAWVVLGLLS
jgi:hypothetical protein